MEVGAQATALRLTPREARRRFRSARILSPVVSLASQRLWSGRFACVRADYSHPLDTIKVRMQLSKSRKMRGVSKECSSPDCSSNLWGSLQQGGKLRREKHLWDCIKAWARLLVGLCQKWPFGLPPSKVSLTMSRADVSLQGMGHGRGWQGVRQGDFPR